MKSLKLKLMSLVTKANLLIAFVVVALIFLLYGNKPMMNDWASMIGMEWIWVPVLLILFAALIFGRFFFKKKVE
jgi:hypothetical protein